MAEFIVNPRRAPRAPARCRTAVFSQDGPFECETEDVGSRGCQLVAPRRVRKGEKVELHLTNGKLDPPLRVRGTVAWVSPQAPWRLGIAFDEESVPGAARWFERLVAAHPGLGAFRRVPEKIPVEAMVYLGPPPRFLLDFTADEASLLRAIASGARLDELMARLRDRWPAAQRALFSLMARQMVTLNRGQAAHVDAWKKVLTEVEASLAVESLGSVGPTLTAPPPPPPAPAPAAARSAPTPAPARRAPTPAPREAPPSWGAPTPSSGPMLELADDGPSLEIVTPAPARGAARAMETFGRPEASGAPSGTPAPRADFTGAGVGWRARAPRLRTPEAQRIFEEALLQIEAANVNGAIGLLRRALALSPGDPEIAAELGKLAFKDRAGPE